MYAKGIAHDGEFGCDGVLRAGVEFLYFSNKKDRGNIAECSRDIRNSEGIR